LYDKTDSLRQRDRIVVALMGMSTAHFIGVAAAGRSLLFGRDVMGGDRLNL
jgi:hypothetical protein